MTDLARATQHLTDYYNRFSANYDEGEFHPRLAARLLARSCARAGQTVLDIATGTGWIALGAARVVGQSGHVVGVDISSGMLSQAKRKVVEAGLTNVDFCEADGGLLPFPDTIFDMVICSSALALMGDIPSTLLEWFRVLKPGGLVAFDGPSKDAFVPGVVLASVANAHGIRLVYGEGTGTTDACRRSLSAAGFHIRDVCTVEFGHGTMPLHDAEAMWDRSLQGPPANALLKLPERQLQVMKHEYYERLGALATDGKLATKATIHLAVGRKPEKAVRINCAPHPTGLSAP